MCLMKVALGVGGGIAAYKAAEVVRLLQSGLSDEELGRYPLMQMLRSHGSRGWEESVE